MWRTHEIVVFDCDSTLVTIEGVDELARLRGKIDQVSRLTREAMEGRKSLDDIYASRLKLISPTRTELRILAQRYVDSLVEDAYETVAALIWLGLKIYIVSAALSPAVKHLAVHLDIPEEHVLAVEPEYDALSGEWWRYYHHQYGGNPDERIFGWKSTPLVERDGKRNIIAGIRHAQEHVLLVGDGVTDLLASPEVDLFVGYGGVVRRPKVEQEARIFIRSRSLDPVVALAAGPEGMRKLLRSDHRRTAERGLKLCLTDEVAFSQTYKGWQEKMKGLL